MGPTAIRGASWLGRIRRMIRNPGYTVAAVSLKDVTNTSKTRARIDAAVTLLMLVGIGLAARVWSE